MKQLYWMCFLFGRSQTVEVEQDAYKLDNKDNSIYLFRIPISGNIPSDSAGRVVEAAYSIR